MSEPDQNAERELVQKLVMEIETVMHRLMPEDDGQTAQFSSFMMTAASVFAGSIMGQMIVTGVADEKDKRRHAELAASNFRTGIEVGRRKAMRVIATTFGEGHA